MLKILKNLKNSFWTVLIIVLLLCVQASVDLALPDYTSKIVNVGIQSGGIENAVPEIITKEDMQFILIFAQNPKEIEDNYTLIGKEKSKYEQKIVDKYLGKNASVETESIYILKEISDKQFENISKEMVTPLMKTAMIKNEETQKQIKEQMIAKVPEIQKE